MMKELFTIGEVSRLFQTNIRTLRYYDSIGLLKPARVDEKTGYRYYSTKDFERLNTIKYLRTLDMPLADIQMFFENKDVAVMKQLLQKQKTQIQSRIEELNRIQTKLDNRLKQLDEAEHSFLGQITLKEMGRRRVAVLRKDIAITDDLELPIRELERTHHLEPIIFLGKVGVSIAREKLLKREFTSFSGIFVLVEPSDERRLQRHMDWEDGKEKVKEDNIESYLPGGLYLTIRFQGTHTQAPAYYEELLRFAGEKGYQLSGDSLEITLIDAGLTNDVSNYVTEIQLPVISNCKSGYKQP